MALALSTPISMDEKQRRSRQRDQPHAPVKQEHHDRDDAGGQKAAGRDHHHAGGCIRLPMAAPGYVCCIFVGAAQTACLASTVIPLRAIAGMRIANSVETGE